MVSFPNHSHMFRDSYGSGMGIVWEAYQYKGVPSLGVPENPTERAGDFFGLPIWSSRFHPTMSTY